MARDFAITTVDNPFDPITQFQDWFIYDTRYLGYCTCARLDRICCSSRNLPPNDQDEAVEDAMLELVELMPDIYKIVRGQEEGDDEEAKQLSTVLPSYSEAIKSS